MLDAEPQQCRIQARVISRADENLEKQIPHGLKPVRDDNNTAPGRGPEDPHYPNMTFSSNPSRTTRTSAFSAAPEAVRLSVPSALPFCSFCLLTLQRQVLDDIVVLGFEFGHQAFVGQIERV